MIRSNCESGIRLVMCAICWLSCVFDVSRANETSNATTIAASEIEVLSTNAISFTDADILVLKCGVARGVVYFNEQTSNGVSYASYFRRNSSEPWQASTGQLFEAYVRSNLDNNNLSLVDVGSMTTLKCGTMSVKWSYPNWIYPPKRNKVGMQINIAVQRREELPSLDTENSKIQWFACDDNVLIANANGLEQRLSSIQMHSDEAVGIALRLCRSFPQWSYTNMVVRRVAIAIDGLPSNMNDFVDERLMWEIFIEESKSDSGAEIVVDPRKRQATVRRIVTGNPVLQWARRGLEQTSGSLIKGAVNRDMPSSGADRENRK